MKKSPRLTGVKRANGKAEVAKSTVDEPDGAIEVAVDCKRP